MFKKMKNLRMKLHNMLWNIFIGWNFDESYFNLLPGQQMINEEKSDWFSRDVPKFSDVST